MQHFQKKNDWKIKFDTIFFDRILINNRVLCKSSSFTSTLIVASDTPNEYFQYFKSFDVQQELEKKFGKLFAFFGALCIVLCVAIFASFSCNWNKKSLGAPFNSFYADDVQETCLSVWRQRENKKYIERIETNSFCNEMQ